MTQPRDRPMTRPRLESLRGGLGLREPPVSDHALRKPNGKRWQRLPLFLHLRAVKGSRRVSLSRACEVVRGDHAAELALEPVERIALELPHALAREAQVLADRLERGRLAGEAVAKLDDATLPLGQSRECLLHRLALERLGRVLERIRRRRIAEEVAELGVALGTDTRV